jgi:hypothetical protein
MIKKTYAKERGDGGHVRRPVHTAGRTGVIQANIVYVQTHINPINSAKKNQIVSR